MTAEEIVRMCSSASALAPREEPPDLGTDDAGVPRWHPYEFKVWQIGEDIRLALKAAPKLRADSQVQECLLMVAEDRRFRRGRQPFIMNLGYRAAASHAARVAALLGDDDVAGHALDTLLKMDASGFARQVWPLVTAQPAWVRKLAKKYLKRHGG
jgi:hypothetical protein